MDEHTELFLVLPSIFMESNLAVSHTGREGERGDWLIFQQQPLGENSNRTHYSTETSSGEIHGRLGGRYRCSQLYWLAVMTVLTV